MRIAINTIPLLSPLTGVGHYTYQIAKALREISTEHRYTYFYGYYSQELQSPEESHQVFCRFKETIRKTPILGSSARKFQDVLNYFSSRRFDLYFEPQFIPLNIPAQRTVVTILDFSFVRFPEWHPEDKIRYFKKYFWEKIKGADHIIVISNFIKNEAVDLFGFQSDRISAIHLGIDPNLFRIYDPEEFISIKNKYQLPDNFILFVGSIEPRKNIFNLLKAYGDLRHSMRKTFKLVLVGNKGWKNEQTLSLIRESGDDVRYLGYVPEIELGPLYRLARLFVYPSFYEGFGLPPLEAMACGCPVIVSHTASLPEVCGEAAFYINPHEVESISAGMERILENETLRNALKSKGLERSKLFSWNKAAEEHLRLFEKIFI